jgi:hypothetical protein
MPPFFVNAPAILNVATFQAYGGAIGTATPAQQNAAFAMAEQWCASEIGCPLTTTNITGTFTWPAFGLLQLPHDHIQQVLSVVGLHDAGSCDCDYTELSGCAFLIHPDSGIISLKECGCATQMCGCAGGRPAQVRVVYSAGYASGTVGANPNVLLALTTVAQMALLQMTAPYQLEGGPGAPGVQEFTDGPYHEIRTKLFSTMFGTSPQANFARDLLEQVGLRSHRCMRLY